MSESEYFKQFCSNLRMPQDVVDAISYRCKRITKQANKDYWDSESETLNSIFVGSYGRGTDIFVSDIDLLVVLPFSKYNQYDSYTGNGQSALLQEVKESIKKTYSASYIRADGQVIRIDFDDGISFEIVPGFLNKDEISYTYPDTNNGGSWKVTNPRAEIKEINNANNNWNKNLKRLCRMARAWKDVWDVPIKGLLIDTLAYNFMGNWKYKNNSFTYYYYDWMSRDFFSYLMSCDENQSYWFAPGSGQRVFRTGKFEYKAKQCYKIALDAIKNQSDGNELDAKKKWREIYGPKFPS